MKLLIVSFICIIQIGSAQTPSTWNVIQRNILDKQCINCHTAGSSFASQSGLVLTQDVAYQSLVDVKPKNAAALKDSLMRVSSKGSLPGVGKSFLWEKIDASQQSHYNNDHPYYGSMMPLGGNFLTKGELKLIHEWIYAGAPQTGVVADSTVLDDTSRYTLPPFAPLPVPANGMQFRVGPFTVQPNSANDREFYYYVPPAHTEDLFVNRVEIIMRSGSHHFIMYTFNSSMPSSLMPNPYVYRDLRDTVTGEYNAALFYQLFYHSFFAGTQTPYANFNLPKGVAIRLPAKTGFDMNSHYVNRTGTVQTGEVYANIYTVPKSQVLRVAEVLNLGNNSFELPPHSVTEVSKTFSFNEKRHIIQLMTHAHERMKEFRVEIAGGPNNGRMVYWTDDWQHPPILFFDPPMTLNPGEGLKAVATYNNTTNNTIRFGFQSTDEMMIVFGAYYTGELLSVHAEQSLPAGFRLKQNYPNPFNPSTVIEYSVPSAGSVELSVYDVLGKQIALLINGHRPAGTDAVRFDASKLPSGIYFYRLTFNGRSEIGRMVLMK